MTNSDILSYSLTFKGNTEQLSGIPLPKWWKICTTLLSFSWSRGGSLLLVTPRHMTSYSPCVWSMAIISSGFCHFLGIGMCSSITRKMKVYSLCWVSSTGRRGWSPSRDSNQLNPMLKFKNTPQTVSLRLFTFHCVLRLPNSSTPFIAWTITLWAYLSEPLGHKCLSLTEKPQYRVLKSHITVTYVLWRGI